MFCVFKKEDKQIVSSPKLRCTLFAGRVSKLRIEGEHPIRIARFVCYIGIYIFKFIAVDSLHL